MRGLTIRAGMVAGLAVLATAGSASAATLEVTRTGDQSPGACTASDCSLREAVIKANSTAANDRIVLRKQTYTLGLAGDDDDAAAGDLDVVAGSGRLTIAGKGAGKTSIDGNDVDRILDVLAGARLSVTAVTLRNGSTPNAGGGIQNRGSTTIQRSTLQSNAALLGGAIHTEGDGRLIASRTGFIGNEASFAGGLNSQNEATTRLVRTRFVANQAHSFGGGGIYNANDARMVVKKSIIDRNLAVGFVGGGGIYNQNDAQLRISGSTISRNRALTEQGGGIYTQNSSLLTLTNSTLSGNRADEGGAIYANNWPYITINFSTIAKNSAVTAGGAIYANTAGNNLLRPPPFWRMRGTIVAKNSSPGADNCALAAVSDPTHFDSRGSNLDDENSCFFTRGSDQRNSAAKLRRLAKNGGGTKSHALKPSSDAVNAARKRGCPGRDQRGVKRPQGRRCDIGSYELKQR